MDISHIPLALKAKTSWGEWDGGGLISSSFHQVSNLLKVQFPFQDTYIENLGNISLKKSYDDHVVTTNIADSCVSYFLVENPIYYKGH